MKKIKSIVMMGCFLCGGTTLFAQATIYDADRFMSRDLNGTARFVGMGGAMGALGGDISVMGTNPAGIGIYRSGDVMTSFGFNGLKSESNLSGSKLNTDKFSGSFDNIGFVFAHKVGDVTPLRFVNFGFNYNRVKSFNKNFAMRGDLNGLSQTDQMAALTDGLSESDFNASNPSLFKNHNIGWLSVLGYNGHLINPNGFDENGEQLYQGLYEGVPPSGSYRSEERGGLHSYDFNVSFNFLDAIYVGGTLGAYSVDYSRYSYYSEDHSNRDTYEYTLQNWNKTTGSGIDFKLGIIVRPTDSFRFGVAVHTPTLFNLRDTYSAALYTDLANVSETKYIDTYDEIGNREFPYKLVTPWKFNFSLGGTIGRVAAIGAEYEYSDHSSAKLKYDDGEHMYSENSMIKDGLKGVHTFRVGAEIKVMPELSLRAGYNYITESIYSDAFKNLPLNSERTDTEFFNGKSQNNITLGLGYRGNSPFYADVAYQFSAYKQDFYAFDDLGGQVEDGIRYNLPATKVDNKRHQLLVTVGMRF